MHVVFAVALLFSSPVLGQIEDESAVPHYTLPDPLTMSDGTPVS